MFARTEVKEINENSSNGHIKLHILRVNFDQNGTLKMSVKYLPNGGNIRTKEIYIGIKLTEDLKNVPMEEEYKDEEFDGPIWSEWIRSGCTKSCLRRR